jgi:hypothetical protein
MGWPLIFSAIVVAPVPDAVFGVPGVGYVPPGMPPNVGRPHGHCDIPAELRLRYLHYLLDRAAVLGDVHAVDALDAIVGLPLRRLNASEYLS